MDAIKTNNVDAKLNNIDITDSSNYILEFTEEKKKIMLGDTNDLSAKMAWINFFIKENKDKQGTVYLNTANVYFSPN